MTLQTRRFAAATLAALLLLAGPGAMITAADEQRDDADTVKDDHDSDDPALDDGKGLLSKASITFEAARATAEKATGGTAEEVDLEIWNGKLVFDVDLGTKTAKVDATTGTLIEVTDKNPTTDQD